MERGAETHHDREVNDMNVKRIAIIIATTFGAAACGAQDPVDLGHDEPAKTGEFLSDYAASWDGYVEAYAFASGTDRVRLVLDENGEGYLQLGDVPLLDPPSDPDVGYPPGVDYSFPAASLAGTMEGFQYTALAASVQNRRIQFAVYGQELYADWCALQTSYYQPMESQAGEAIYSCIPEGGVSFGDECSVEGIPFDCDKVGICVSRSACTCDADGCSAPAPMVESVTAFPTHLDGALDNAGKTLVGTLVLDGMRLNIRLERQ
jgi:hypothetical protein